MARKRVTKEEKQQRHEWAMKQIDKVLDPVSMAKQIKTNIGCFGPERQ